MNDFPPYQPPFWAKNAHLQTILPALLHYPAPIYTRERWCTPDDDFIDLDWVNHAQRERVGQHLLILFHGLEGSSRSSYAKSLMTHAAELGWSGVVVHWRSCSGEMNRQRVMYHSGFSAEIDWILRRLARDYPQAQRFVVGVSLGGNALLKWLGEQGKAARPVIDAAVAVSAPHDLKASSIALKNGFSRQVYMRDFLSTLRQKALAKRAQFPDLGLDEASIRGARDFFDLDNCVTAPLHGFRDAEDYWQQSSCKPFLADIAIPTLILNSLNDPFNPAHSLATKNEIASTVRLCYPPQGGHVGYLTARSNTALKHLNWMPRTVVEFATQSDD